MDEIQKLRDELGDLRRQHGEADERLRAIEARLDALTGGEPAAETAAPEELARDPGETSTAGVETSLESRIGGIWLNRVGVLAFILGAAFFIGYAFDQGWIGEVTRVLIGVAGGLLLLGLGERVRRRGFAAYAAGLTGGGIALLYFSVYAAFHFYGLLAPAVAMVLVVLVTVLAVALALMGSSPAVGALGLLTGFLTPVLFSTGDPRFATLLTYLLVLNAGLAAVTVVRGWGFLAVPSFLLTHIYLLATGLTSLAGNLTPDLTPTGHQAFMACFLVLFTATGCVWAERRGGGGVLASFLVVGAGLLHYGLSWLGLSGAFPDFMGPYTLGLAALYVLLGVGLRLMVRLPGASSSAFFVAGSLLVLFVPVQLEGAAFTAGWILQAAALGFFGNRFDLRGVRWGGYLVMVLAGFRLLLGEWIPPVDAGDYSLILNGTMLMSALYVGALALTGWSCRFRDGGRIAMLLAGGAMMLAVAFVSADVVRWGDVMALATGQGTYYRNLTMMILSLLWALSASALAVAGFVLRQPRLRYAAMALLGVTVVKVFMVDLRFLDLIYRIISLVAVGLILLGVSLGYQLVRARGTRQ